MNTTLPETIESVADLLTQGAEPCMEELRLALGDCNILVRSNSPEVIGQLKAYFGHALGLPTPPTMEVMVVERTAIDPEKELGITFIDWKREPGKTGRKDSYFDFDGARLVRKVRTGMVFLQSETRRVAAGACYRYDNQVINFINAQYMNWLQQRDWLICHASGLVHKGATLGIAGFSGGGKSTLMLRLMEHPEINYLTNDRLFIKQESNTVQAIGIPKLPRVNPGTIVHNPRLHPLIPEAQREALLELPNEELWDLEEKYDVLINDLYSGNRITPIAPLSAFLVLNWQRDSDEPAQLNRVDLNERPELLGAIMKSPGPFYQYADGSFFTDDTPLDSDAYLRTLETIPAYEATGGIDFEKLEHAILENLLASSKTGDLV